MFRIKVCGVTSTDDAMAAAAAGADCIGLNFCTRSPRSVEMRRAAEIVQVLPRGVVKVGVFVDAPLGEIRDVADRLRLDLVQLHGDEPPELLADLGERPVIRAFRCGAEGLAHLVHYLDQCRRLQALPQMVLLDSPRTGGFGGTGQLADWQSAKQYHDTAIGPPLVLAGGLDPGNVAQAIATVRPAAVDTASGVESSPGQKDRGKVAAFVAAAQAAFAGLGSARRPNGENQPPP